MFSLSQITVTQRTSFGLFPCAGSTQCGQTSPSPASSSVLGSTCSALPVAFRGLSGFKQERNVVVELGATHYREAATTLATTLWSALFGGGILLAGDKVLPVGGVALQEVSKPEGGGVSSGERGLHACRRHLQVGLDRNPESCRKGVQTVLSLVAHFAGRKWVCPSSSSCCLQDSATSRQLVSHWIGAQVLPSPSSVSGHPLTGDTKDQSWGYPE